MVSEEPSLCDWTVSLDCQQSKLAYTINFTNFSHDYRKLSLGPSTYSFTSIRLGIATQSSVAFPSIPNVCIGTVVSLQSLE
jgi:hypothetical protein